jgi:hypothetical protein
LERPEKAAAEAVCLDAEKTDGEHIKTKKRRQLDRQPALPEANTNETENISGQNWLFSTNC